LAGPNMQVRAGRTTSIISQKRGRTTTRKRAKSGQATLIEEGRK
jgi:hypothetical protein